MKIGIIGYNNVGKAVEYGFNSPNNQFIIVDEALTSTTVGDAVDTDVVFVCITTDDTKQLETIDLTKALVQLVGLKYRGLVFVKSMLPPGIVDTNQWKQIRRDLQLVINPDNVGEYQPNRTFVESPMIILGADNQQLIDDAKAIYEHSNVVKKWFMEMSLNEAILMKLFTDTFLATKASLIGEFSQMLGKFSDRDWNEFACMMTHDPRIGRSMTEIHGQPGYSSVHYPAMMFTFARTAIQSLTISGTASGAMVSNTLLKAK
jgi:UDP-glucose 6-dehydrogenase